MRENKKKNIKKFVEVPEGKNKQTNKQRIKIFSLWLLLPLFVSFSSSFLLDSQRKSFRSQTCSKTKTARKKKTKQTILILL